MLKEDSIAVCTPLLLFLELLLFVFFGQSPLNQLHQQASQYP
jgi:hypothetical protein